MNVELIYDADCPNVEPARSLLIRAFMQTGISARWKEWDRASPDSPSYVRGYGSPTLLVNGRDITGLDPSHNTHACRVYTGTDGALQSTPPLELICRALLEAAPPEKDTASRGRWHAIAASFPAIGAALLPKLTCPLCWPAYAALLSTLGFGFFNYTPYLMPLTLIFLVLALGGLAIQAKRSGQRTAFILGVTGAAIVLLGKFAFELDWLNTAGVGLLITAIFISMRRKTMQGPACPACVNIDREAKAETR